VPDSECLQSIGVEIVASPDRYREVGQRVPFPHSKAKTRSTAPRAIAPVFAPALVVQVGSTQLRYRLCCIEDLHAMLEAHGGWMQPGSADEQKPAAEGTVEAWGRSPKNPAGGWYVLKKGLRGRFAMYVPQVLKRLGLAEVEENPRNNRIRAI
jgi:hypothetical protein